ncbi:hypothetical protein M0R45_036662 [Rubus argutus]|uniref:Integrase catalytic domain-containing protein n=1 Tax=Rubus argutus TaxID=59490 RepID=A0AAW1W096_RUBAR
MIAKSSSPNASVSQASASNVPSSPSCSSTSSQSSTPTTPTVPPGFSSPMLGTVSQSSPNSYVPISPLPYGYGTVNPYAMFNPMQMGPMSGFYAGRSSANGNTNFQSGNRGQQNNYQRRTGDNYGGFNNSRNAGFGFNRSNAGNSLTCQLCGRVGHGAKTCRTLSNFQQSNSSSDISCQYCGKDNHTADRCFFLIGFPGQQQQQNSSSHQASAMLATNQYTPQYWLADSGATNHMTSDAQVLSNITSMPTSDSVQVGNGAQLPVTHFGNTKLGSLILKNVLLIPELAAHLLSIYQLCKQNNCSVWFDEFMCIIQDKVLGKILFKGLSKHGLYPIPFDLPLLQASTSGFSQSTSVLNKAFLGKSVKHSLWHQRFGHPSNEIVTVMLNKTGISSLPSSNSSICEPCLLGKFHKLPFPKSVSRCQKPFELVHSDVWGPSPHLSIDGFRYFVLFIDDCTRFTWIFPMKNKSEVFQYFQYLCALIQNQFSTSVKTLRSDGGGEYMSLKFKEFLNLKGIIHQVSCPHSPKQNGVSERKNRHLRETTVTLLQNASLPPLFWYHACAISTYLINRMPTPTLNMISPFECLYNQLPPVDMLRVFGCACYPLMTPYRANKLQPKTVRCIFVGFANGYKGYICFNPLSRKFIISRHVFFDESLFPYASVTSSSASSNQHNASSTQISSAVMTSSPRAYTQSTSQQLPTPVQLHHPVIPLPQVVHPLLNSSPTSPISTCNEDQSHNPPFCDFIDNDPVLSTSSSPTENIGTSSTNSSSDTASDSSPFGPHIDTSIQFQENDGSLSIQTQPGAGTISVILDCVPDRPASQISSSNILHPVDGITEAPINDHPMLTRSKRGVFKKKCFLSILSQVNADPCDTEPLNYKSALHIPEWKQAMQEEYAALMNQNTWSLVPLPPDKNLVSCKWLFKLKRNADGSIARHKARLLLIIT